ncbi:MAG: hypothetical protein ACRBBN_10535 [Methyloligellaceae bacterium]
MTAYFGLIFWTTCGEEISCGECINKINRLISAGYSDVFTMGAYGLVLLAKVVLLI